MVTEENFFSLKSSIVIQHGCGRAQIWDDTATRWPSGEYLLQLESSAPPAKLCFVPGDVFGVSAPTGEQSSVERESVLPVSKGS